MLNKLQAIMAAGTAKIETLQVQPVDNRVANRGWATFHVSLNKHSANLLNDELDDKTFQKVFGKKAARDLQTGEVFHDIFHGKFDEWVVGSSLDILNTRRSFTRNHRVHDEFDVEVITFDPDMFAEVTSATKQEISSGTVIEVGNTNGDYHQGILLRRI